MTHARRLGIAVAAAVLSTTALGALTPAQAADTTQDSSWGCGGMCRTG